MIEIAMAERPAPIHAAFQQLYETCQLTGNHTKQSDASVIHLDYAFFNEYPDIPVAMQLGQSMSYVDVKKHERTIGFAVCWAEDGTGVGLIDPGHIERPYSILRLFDQADFTSPDHVKLTGTYIARSNENPNADLVMFKIEGQGLQTQLSRLNEQEQTDLADKLQQIDIPTYQ